MKSLDFLTMTPFWLTLLLKVQLKVVYANPFQSDNLSKLRGPVNINWLAILDKVELETSNLCYPISSINNMKMRQSLIGVRIQVFLLTPQTQIFVKIVKFSDAPNLLIESYIVNLFVQKFSRVQGSLFTPCIVFLNLLQLKLTLYAAESSFMK